MNYNITAKIIKNSINVVVKTSVSQTIITRAYAGIYIYSNSISQLIPNGLVYTKITQFTANDLSFNATPDFSNNKITIIEKGIYKIIGSFSISSGKNNIVINSGVFLNDIEQPQIHLERKIAVANDIGDTGFTGFINADVGDVLDLRIIHNYGSPVDITFEYGNINIEYLKK